MSLPFFNMYPRDFEADTSHLSLEEDGAYNRLLRLCWMNPNCSLPDDDIWIMRRMRVDSDTFERVVRVVLNEFFTRKSGRVSNARLDREYAKSGDAHSKRVSAGKLGGKAKSLKTKGNSSSIATAMPKQPEPEPEPEPNIREEPKGSLSFDLAPEPIDEISQAVAAYNESAAKAGWPKVQSITPARRSRLKARLKEAGGLEGWNIALAKARASPHCCGENDRGWRASFDFLTAQESFAKLMEGNYDAKPSNLRQSIPQGRGDRIDPAIANIARIVGLDQAQGDDRFGIGGFGEKT